MRHGIALLACAIIWSDVFSIPAAELQFGPHVRQEVKVEVCSVWNGKTIQISTRLYRADLGTNVSDWKVRHTTIIGPFDKDGKDIQVPSPPYEEMAVP